MTIDALRRFAASAQCMCGSRSCVLLPETATARIALLAALDFIAAFNDRYEGERPLDEEMRAFENALAGEGVGR